MLEQFINMAVGEVVDRLAPVQVITFNKEDECNVWLRKNAGKIFIEKAGLQQITSQHSGFVIWYNESPQLNKQQLTDEVRKEIDVLINKVVEDAKI